MDEMNILLTLPPHTDWELSECEPFLSNLVERYQTCGVRLKVTIIRDVAEPTEGESDLLDRFMLGRSSSKTIRLDLTDARLYRSVSSVIFALVARLMTSAIDVPVEFGSDRPFDIYIHGLQSLVLPRHHLMLSDSYASKHLEDYEAASERNAEFRRVVLERIMTVAEASRSMNISQTRLTLERERNFIRAWERAYQQLILFVEKLSAAGMLTDAMEVALDQLADGAYEQALDTLVDGAHEDTGTSSPRTPDELLLRYFILRTRTDDPQAEQEARLTLQKAAEREADQLLNGAALSSGTALLEHLKRQMIRQDYEQAVVAANHCLKHPAHKASVEALHLKALALTELRRYSEADRAFDKAVKLCQEEARTKPVTVLPILALCLCDKARALTGAGQVAAAQASLQQAQEILVREVPGQEILGQELLGQPTPDSRACDAVSLTAYIASVRLLQERYRLSEPEEQAEKQLQQAIDYLLKAGCGYPDPMGVYLYAKSHNIKAELYLAINQENKMNGEVLGARSSIETLRTMMPDALPVLLADIVNNQGISLADNEYTLNEAKQAYLNAVELLEQEAPESVVATELLGDCYYNLGLLYDDWDKRRKAEDYLRKAREQYVAVGRDATKMKLQLIAEELDDLKRSNR